MSACRGKTALVTNASHVTGRAAAHALAKAGAQVLMHDDRSTARLQIVVEEIRSTGGVAKAITADISTAEGPHQLARQAREIVGDRLDILVVNAEAVGSADTTVETFDTQYAVNTRAPFFLVQQLLPILSRGSSIIFTSPPGAAKTPEALPAYLSTRDAVTNLVAHFAPVLEARGIRVNAIMQDRKKRAVPEDIGAAITFLASKEASRITGQALPARFTKRRRTGVGGNG